MTRRRSTQRSSTRESFRLHAPNRTLWMLALVLFLIGLAGTVLDVGINVEGRFAIWALIFSSGLLLLATAANTS